MCGIFGIWNTDGRPVDLLALRRATGAIRHRGPDDEGYLLVDTRSGRTVLCSGENTAPELGLPRLEQFGGERFDLAFGFRRLSILDLSPAGHQPMPSHDGRYWLVFNGEVYNYLELRSELASRGYSFRSGTDTEVILAAYGAWGPECIRRFNGMWGLAIWDNERRELFVSRDRFGVKPLYVASTNGGTFAFASEIKALLAAEAMPFRPSRLAVARYVTENRLPSHLGGETFFEGVRELPAAHYAVIKGPDYSYLPRRYWAIPRRERTGEVSAEQVTERYRELFTDAVRVHLRADVPVGTCLSGGVDSSSIVGVAGKLMQTEHAISLERLGEHQQTFSAVYETEGRWNERYFVDRVVESTGAAGNYTFPTIERLWGDLERLVWHQEEPFQGTSIFAQWCVMGLARERGVTVLLDGQGADEVLGGYRPFAVMLGELARAGSLGRALRELREIRAVTGMSLLPLLARALAWQLPNLGRRKLWETRLRQAVGRSGLVRALGVELLAADRKLREPYRDRRTLDAHLRRLVVEDSLPNLLRFEDRNSMAFSIEARVPFLDYRLVEYAFTEGAPWRIYSGWTKWLQRVAVTDLLPAEVVWRRDKVGFETPEKLWLRGSVGQVLGLFAHDGVERDYLDLDFVRREVPRLLSEGGNTDQVWRWIDLTLWLRRYSSFRPSSLDVERQPVAISS